MRHDQRLHSLVLAHAGHRRARRLIDSLHEATRLLGTSTVDTSRSLHDIRRGIPADDDRVRSLWSDAAG